MWVGIVLAALTVGELAADPHPEGPCPSRADVEAELARVGAVGVAPPDVSVVGDRMHVVLRGRDGATVGSREVEVPETCYERATVAAVFVATWMGIWPEAPKAAAAPPPALPSPPADTLSAPVPSSMSSGASPTEIGLAVVGAHDGNAAALGGAIEVRRQLVGPLLGWAGVSATTERDRRVGPAAGGYLRPALDLGPAFRLGGGRVQADLAASGRLGVLILRGKDLPVTHQKVHVVPGVAAQMRVVIAGERLSPFVVVGGCYWFGQQQLWIENELTATADLPRWDVEAGLGLFWAP